MIRPLRLRHRHLWMVLGLIIPGIFFVSIMGRVAIEPMAELPVSAFGILDAPSSFTFGEIRVEIDPSHPQQVRVDAPMQTALADALVYWSASKDVADGYLLGALVPGRRHVFSLGSSRTERTGYLLVYSLAHQEIELAHELHTPRGTP